MQLEASYIKGQITRSRKALAIANAHLLHRVARGEEELVFSDEYAAVTEAIRDHAAWEKAYRLLSGGDDDAG